MKNFNAFLLLFLFTAVLSAQLINPEKKQKIDDLISHLEANNQMLGSIAITQNGTAVYSNSLSSDLLPNAYTSNEHTRYQIGSITKMFTAVMLAKLQEQEKIKFTEKLAAYYPEMPRANEITLEQMLNHTSGMQDYLLKNDSITDWLLYPQTREDILVEIKRQDLAFEPGERFQYSNSAYYLLARILETTTKLSYPATLEKLITDPLKMKSTEAYAKGSFFSNLASPYEFVGDSWNIIKDFDFYNASGVGDIISTPADLNLFMNALNNGKIIKKETLQAMMPVGKAPFGSGIMTVPFYNYKGYGHGGDTMGTHCVTSFFKDSNLSITYMVNGQRYDTNDFAIGVLSILYDKPFELPVFTKFKTTPQAYDSYAGTYANPDFPLAITITNKGTFLQGQGTGQPSFPLTQIAEQSFEFKDADLTLVFNPENNTMNLTQSGYKVILTRK